MTCPIITCSKCGKSLDSTNRYRRSTQCKPCYLFVQSKWREKNREKTRAYSREWMRRNKWSSHKHKLRYRYGMSPEDYASLLQSQDGKCAICGRAESKIDKTGNIQMLSVDHCHRTGKNRGLLCDSCNRAIGALRDDVDTLLKAISYIQKHSVVEVSLR